MYEDVFTIQFADGSVQEVTASSRERAVDKAEATGKTVANTPGSITRTDYMRGL